MHLLRGEDRDPAFGNLRKSGAYAGVVGQPTILDRVVQYSCRDAVDLANGGGCERVAELLDPGLDLRRLDFVESRVAERRIHMKSGLDFVVGGCGCAVDLAVPPVLGEFPEGHLAGVWVDVGPRDDLCGLLIEPLVRLLLGLEVTRPFLAVRAFIAGPVHGAPGWFANSIALDDFANVSSPHSSPFSSM